MDTFKYVCKVHSFPIPSSAEKITTTPQREGVRDAYEEMYTDRQIDRQTERKDADRQTDRQTDT